MRACLQVDIEGRTGVCVLYVRSVVYLFSCRISAASHVTGQTTGMADGVIPRPKSPATRDQSGWVGVGGPPAPPPRHGCFHVYSDSVHSFGASLVASPRCRADRIGSITRPESDVAPVLCLLGSHRLSLRSRASLLPTPIKLAPFAVIRLQDCPNLQGERAVNAVELLRKRSRARTRREGGFARFDACLEALFRNHGGWEALLQPDRDNHEIRGLARC